MQGFYGGIPAGNSALAGKPAYREKGLLRGVETLAKTSLR